LKRYIKSDEEKKQADKYEEQRGVLMYFLSGLLPSVYWLSWLALLIVTLVIPEKKFLICMMVPVVPS